MADYVRVIMNRIPEVELELEVRAQELADWAAEQTAEEARTLAPVLTGALRDSIVAEPGRVTVGVPYAAFVEYGTHKMAAEPYLTPAMVRVEGEIPVKAGEIGGSL